MQKNQGNRTSPYITPPLRHGILTWHHDLPILPKPLVTALLYHQAPNHPHCPWGLMMEVSHQGRCMHILHILPRVLLIPIALPLDQILQLVPSYLAVQDLLHLILHLVTNHHWWGRQLSLVARDRVRRAGS